MSENKGLVLCIGLVCTDIVNVVKSYPDEDTDQRVLEQRWTHGGNAFNSSVVLSLLGTDCEFLGTLALDDQVRSIKADLEAHNIAYNHCIYHEGYPTPTSVIIVNNQNGSRTILFSGCKRPELSYEDFEKVELTEGKYTWIHFEGRPGCQETRKMLQRIEEHNNSLSDPSKRIITSVELEKPREELGLLEDAADFVFVSKEHAQFRGCTDMEKTVAYFATRSRPNATIICPWGDQGAVARSTDGTLHRSPAFPPANVIDTLAAGDTFNAATIHALSRGDSISDAIIFGCRVAGAKVGMKGLDGLRTWYTDYSKTG